MKLRTARVMFGINLVLAQLALTFVPQPFNTVVWGGLMALAAYFMGYSHALNSKDETQGADK